MSRRSALPLRMIVVLEGEDYIEHAKETEGENRGPAVEWFLEAAGIDTPEAWCAAFVNRIAEIACSKKNIRSPLERVPLQGYVQSYVDYGKSRDWVVEEPGFGDLFAIYHAGKRRYAHIGIVADAFAPGGRFRTVEGNSNDEGSREGYEVCANQRPYSDGVLFLNPWGD